MQHAQVTSARFTFNFPDDTRECRFSILTSFRNLDSRLASGKEEEERFPFLGYVKAHTCDLRPLVRCWKKRETWKEGGALWLPVFSFGPLSPEFSPRDRHCNTLFAELVKCRNVGNGKNRPCSSEMVGVLLHVCRDDLIENLWRMLNL